FASRSNALRDLTFLALTRSWSTTRTVPAITATAPIVRRVDSTISLSLARVLRSRSEAVAAHHCADRRHIGRAAGGSVENRSHLAKEVGAEDARRCDRQRLGIHVSPVGELVHDAAGDVEHLAGADLARRAFDRPGQGAREPVDRLVVAV